MFNLIDDSQCAYSYRVQRKSVLYYTTVAEIGKEAPSLDFNDPGSATCMDEVNFCEKGHHKGFASSANTNVGGDEVREVYVSFNIYVYMHIFFWFSRNCA